MLSTHKCSTTNINAVYVCYQCQVFSRLLERKRTRCTVAALLLKGAQFMLSESQRQTLASAKTLSSRQKKKKMQLALLPLNPSCAMIAMSSAEHNIPSFFSIKVTTSTPTALDYSTRAQMGQIYHNAFNNSCTLTHTFINERYSPVNHHSIRKG